ncbi:MAG: hypothetical protein LBE36_11375 [Flavobacteriaceae bacterium]|jgi:hypothetical protein|nr:hypothetical protein [Flavobacteriaceae bacterium]
MLAETSAKDISQATNPETFQENANAAYQGGKIAGDARKALEAKTGKKVVTSLNAKTAIQAKNNPKRIGE